MINLNTNKTILQDGKLININYPGDYFYEKRDVAYLLWQLFNRKEFDNKLLDYSDAKKFGWALIEAPLMGYKWFPGQQVYYYLWDESRPIKARHYPINELPAGHKIRMRIRKRVIRLEGRNSGPHGHGSWKHLDSKMRGPPRKKHHRRFIQIMRAAHHKKLRGEGWKKNYTY